MGRDPEILPSESERQKAADRIGHQMYGNNWQRIVASIEDTDPIFANFIKEIPYGSIYPRSPLSLQYREISAISTLTQLGLKSQLKSHIIAARNIGISREEIQELFLHLAMYVGFPLVLDGLKVAKQVFDHEDEKQS